MLWHNFFKDLESEGVLDSTSELRMECLWYCYATVLPNDLNILKEHWNSHRIRKSRHNTVSGRPDSLFYLPEHHGAVENLLLKVPQSEVDYVSEHIVNMNNGSEYQDYFEYVRRSLGSNLPSDWQEADQLYRKLIAVAENGI